MAKPTAYIDYGLCHPDKCHPKGKCKAALACKHKILKQDEQNAPPYPWGLCEGCAMCIIECPLKAIRLL